MDVPRKELYKVIVLGDSGVGKTCILNRYANAQFLTNSKTTVGADFMGKELVIDNRSITLQIWDTAGQERFQALGGAFYRGSDCCVLTYDITVPETFEKLDSWRTVFIAAANPRDAVNFPFVVLGNKSDSEEQRKVSTQDGKNWAEQHGFKFFEVSAKEGTNVNEAFDEIAKIVISKDEQEEIFVVKTVKLNKDDKPNGKGDCKC